VSKKLQTTFFHPSFDLKDVFLIFEVFLKLPLIFLFLFVYSTDCDCYYRRRYNPFFIPIGGSVVPLLQKK